MLSVSLTHTHSVLSLVVFHNVEIDASFKKFHLLLFSELVWNFCLHRCSNLPPTFLLTTSITNSLGVLSLHSFNLFLAHSVPSLFLSHTHMYTCSHPSNIFKRILSLLFSSLFLLDYSFCCRFNFVVGSFCLRLLDSLWTLYVHSFDGKWLFVFFVAVHSFQSWDFKRCQISRNVFLT